MPFGFSGSIDTHDHQTNQSLALLSPRSLRSSPGGAITVTESLQSELALLLGAAVHNKATLLFESTLPTINLEVRLRIARDIKTAGDELKEILADLEKSGVPPNPMLAQNMQRYNAERDQFKSVLDTTTEACVKFADAIKLKLIATGLLEPQSSSSTLHLPRALSQHANTTTNDNSPEGNNQTSQSSSPLSLSTTLSSSSIPSNPEPDGSLPSSVTQCLDSLPSLVSVLDDWLRPVDLSPTSLTFYSHGHRAVAQYLAGSGTRDVVTDALQLASSLRMLGLSLEGSCRPFEALMATGSVLHIYHRLYELGVRVRQMAQLSLQNEGQGDVLSQLETIATPETIVNPEELSRQIRQLRQRMQDIVGEKMLTSLYQATQLYARVCFDAAAHMYILEEYDGKEELILAYESAINGNLHALLPTSRHDGNASLLPPGVDTTALSQLQCSLLGVEVIREGVRIAEFGQTNASVVEEGVKDPYLLALIHKVLNDPHTANARSPPPQDATVFSKAAIGLLTKGLYMAQFGALYHSPESPFYQRFMASPRLAQSMLGSPPPSDELANVAFRLVGGLSHAYDPRGLPLADDAVRIAMADIPNPLSTLEQSVLPRAVNDLSGLHIQPYLSPPAPVKPESLTSDQVDQIDSDQALRNPNLVSSLQLRAAALLHTGSLDLAEQSARAALWHAVVDGGEHPRPVYGVKANSDLDNLQPTGDDSTSTEKAYKVRQLQRKLDDALLFRSAAVPQTTLVSNAGILSEILRRQGKKKESDEALALAVANFSPNPDWLIHHNSMLVSSLMSNKPPK